jgi:hypothetical protein
LEHSTKVDLCEAAVGHAFEEMWREFEFPVPPGGPFLHPQFFNRLQILLSFLPNGVQFCCAAYQQMLPWRSNTAANHTESAASAAIAC